jgi:hypothetical protein
MSYMRTLGILDKMPTSFINPVQYFLQLGNDKVAVNELVGHKLQLRWTGTIFCTVCGKKTRKSFGEGMCWNCFSTSAENSECIVRPELCEAHLHKGRDPEWEERNHNKPHFVYLALTDAPKIGVTRDSQIPTRWIDQGANKAIIIAQTPYRQLAGFIEVVLKEHYTDKTNWQKMLTNQVNDGIDLVEEKEKAVQLLPEQFQEFWYESDEIVELIYPVNEYPTKVSSLTLDKEKPIDLELKGIRGQYFIFEGGQVINIRRHSGYEVELIC